MAGGLTLGDVQKQMGKGGRRSAALDVNMVKLFSKAVPGSKHEEVESSSSADSSLSQKNLEDQLTNDKLKSLQHIFQEADEDDGGGLDMDEFRIAMRRTLGEHLTDHDMDMIFMKVDTNCDGTVDWDEYLSYMLLEYKERDTMNNDSKLNMLPDTMMRVPKTDLHQRNHDSIVGIAIKRTYKKDAEHAGQYMTITKEGVVNYWGLTLQHIRTHQITSKKCSRKMQLWVTDFVQIPTVNMVAVSTTFSTITFYEQMATQFHEVLVIEDLETAVTCMDFWFDPEKGKEAHLAFGDLRGNLFALMFHGKYSTMSFLKPADKGFQSRVSFPMLLRNCLDNVTTYQLAGVHEDSVQRVKYYPQLNGFLSCCRGNTTSLFWGDMERKRELYYKVPKGVKVFSYCTINNIIVTGGKDCLVRVWNPYVQSKPVMLLKGHMRPIIFVTISQKQDQILSVSEDKEIKIFGLFSQTCIQTISRKVVVLGPRPLSAIFFNEERQALIMANNQLARFEHRPGVVQTQGLKSHGLEITAVLYNELFDQIVSGGGDSLVCVWDAFTGAKVIQFCAHKTTHLDDTTYVGITAMCFDNTLRRLVTAARDGCVRIWNFNNGALLDEIRASDQKEITAVITTRGRFISAGWNRTIQSFVDRSDEEHTWSSEHKEDIVSLVLFPPTTIVSASYDGDINLWYLETGHLFNQLNASISTKPLFGKFSLKESRLIGEHQMSDYSASASQTDAHQPKQVASSEAYNNRCNAVEKLLALKTRRITPDSAVLVSSVPNGWVHFWSIHPKGGLVGQFNASHRPTKLSTITAMSTNPENSVLVTGDDSGYLKVWDISSYCIGEAESLRMLRNAAKHMKSKTDFDSQLSIRGRCKRYSTYGSIPTPKPFQKIDHEDFVYGTLTDYIKSANECHGDFEPPPDVTDPENTWHTPKLLSTFRAHLKGITSMEYIAGREYVVTASMDCSIRLWSVYGEFYGIFGSQLPWDNPPETKSQHDLRSAHQSVKPVSRPKRKKEKSSIPVDIKASGSATTLQVLSRGPSKWNTARHVVMVFGPLCGLRNQLAAENKQSKTFLDEHDEKSNKTEILGNSYRKQRNHRLMPTLPKIRQFNTLCDAYSSLPCFELEDTNYAAIKPPQCLVEMKERQRLLTSDRAKFVLRTAIRLSKLTAPSNRSRRSITFSS